jgi:drug/metabolite transporter (DMT)-like permease
MVVVFGPLSIMRGERIGHLAASFSIIDWLLILLLGVMSSWVSLCRSKSYQYEEPARLAVVNYFQPVL